MPVGIEQPLMLVLTVQIADLLADLLERGQVYPLIVNQTATMPVGVQFAGQCQDGAVNLDFLFSQTLPQFSQVAVKLSLDESMVGARTDVLGFSALTHQETDSPHDQRFSRAGFPRDHAQSAVEGNLGL